MAKPSDSANGGLPPPDDTATAWMAAGNCRLYPPATFFPSDGVGVDKARKICAGCPVSDPAWSTPSSTASTTGCGAGAANESGAGS